MGGKHQLQGVATAKLPAQARFHKSFADSFSGRLLLAGATALALFGLPRMGNAQEPNACDTAKIRMTPGEYRKANEFTSQSMFRQLDNPELARSDKTTCFGDCIFGDLPNGERISVSTTVLNGILTLNVIITRSDGTREALATASEDGSKSLATTAAQFEQQTGKKPEFRLVAEDFKNPAFGGVMKIKAVPVSEKGAEPDFSKGGIPYFVFSYVYRAGQKTSVGQTFLAQGYMCSEQLHASKSPAPKL